MSSALETLSLKIIYQLSVCVFNWTAFTILAMFPTLIDKGIIWPIDPYTLYMGHIIQAHVARRVPEKGGAYLHLTNAKLKYSQIDYCPYGKDLFLA